jgi:hypothetical protein
MGNDDYDVIVCKVLIYFYRKLKGKISEDDLKYYLNPMTRQLPIQEDYLNAVLMDLIDQGFIADAKVTRAWGDDVIDINIDNARITMKGVDFLKENSTMHKIAKTLKEAIPIWSLFASAQN